MNDIIEKGRGVLFVLSAPSGAGKTTVAEAVMERVAGLGRSISFTTRPSRTGETDGVDYHFVDEKRFQEMIREGGFLEWAEVHGAYYGTSIAHVRRAVEEERQDLFLVIDVQGAATLREKGVPFRGLFLLPPSLDELKSRLVKRGEDDPGVIEKRLGAARDEIAEATSFDYIVVNDQLDEAVAQVTAIIIAERSRIENSMLHIDRFQQ